MDIACIDGSGNLNLSDAVFGRSYNEPLVHQIVVAYMAGGRQGTHAQKTRAMVSGGGRKPWKQKGTGRARSGTIRSPLWRGGGRAFAKETRNYSQKINKKMYRSGLQSVISELIRQDRLVFIGSGLLELPEPRTKIFKNTFGSLLGEGLTTIVVKSPVANLEFATRSLPDVTVLSVSRLDPVTLVRSSKVLMEAVAAQELENMWL